MTAEEAWNIVADRCHTSTRGDRDDLLVVCDALAVLAEKLNLPDRLTATKQLAEALRIADAAQMHFERLLPPRPEAATKA